MQKGGIKVDHYKILKRSWDILWRYRTLWLFGILLALAVSGGMGGGGNSGFQFNLQDNDISQFRGNWFNGLQQGLDKLGQNEGLIIAALIVVFCFLCVLGLVFTFLRYIANTSLIRMVNDYEETDEQRTIKQGFHMGWSKASWRIFLIDLVINIPVVLVSLVLLVIALSPLLLWLTENRIAGILGSIAAVGMFFLYILAIIGVSAALRILSQFFYRAAALQNLGVFDSIRAGYALFRKNLKDSILMWLILLGIQIVYGIAAVILGILLLLIALPLGGIPGLIAAGLVALLGGGPLPWILGLIVALPIIILVISVPFLVLNGWKEEYLSSAWTLTYREFKALNSSSPLSSPPADNEGIEKVSIDEAEKHSNLEDEDMPAGSV